ncbi:MAG TPA: ABC transporter permease [Candidatus Polarisedimenticolia bacterium]|nr:ABC transporter permease [Candidatus Polarisedimenticolia bacterium]
MIASLARRLLWMIPVVWAAATLVWVFLFLIPGDPARLLAGQSASAETLAAARAEWGLDRPAPERYGRFLANLCRLDLGTSYVQGRPVSRILLEAMARTAVLAAAAAALSACAGIAIALLSARRPGGRLDGLLRLVSTLGVSLPAFWVAMILMLIFASRLRWFPIQGGGDGPLLFGLRLPGLHHLVLPAVTLAIVTSGTLGRVARAALLEETSRPYVTAARARGASRPRALTRHALRNAMGPIVTLAGLNFGWLLGGAVATETVFNWPGMGRTMVQGLAGRDLPVVEGGAIVLTAAFVLVNLAVDAASAALDPRSRP